VIQVGVAVENMNGGDSLYRRDNGFDNFRASSFGKVGDAFD
jgi:hypothetical protein